MHAARKVVNLFIGMCMAIQQQNIALFYALSDFMVAVARWRVASNTVMIPKIVFFFSDRILDVKWVSDSRESVWSLSYPHSPAQYRVWESVVSRVGGGAPAVNNLWNLDAILCDVTRVRNLMQVLPLTGPVWKASHMFSICYRHRYSRYYMGQHCKTKNHVQF